MVKSTGRKLFFRVLTLGVLIMSLILLSYGGNLTPYMNAFGQDETVPSISVLPQPDTPLRISVLTYNSSDQRTPEVVFELTNVSSKPIRAYAVRQETLRGREKSGGSILADMESTNSILQPGQYMTETIVYQPLSEITSQITLSVDFVEFADETTWGANVSKSASLLAGRRAGSREADKRILEVYKSGGVQAVIKIIEANRIDTTPPSGNSPEWEEGFRIGIGQMPKRLKRALDGGGGSQVESELRRLSAKSKGDR